MKKRFVVIMAGGRGERFWPESRSTRPKQLLPIVGDSPMLAQTVHRLAGLVEPEAIFVITNEEQRPAVLESCPDLDPAKVIGEPVGRDTAAAVGLATILVRRADPDATFAMLPADAVIHDATGFRDTLEDAFAAAEYAPVLATIGIPARFPATGYGYIQRGTHWAEFTRRPVYEVERFIEKPNLATAQSYVGAGGYYWNAGIFVWSAAAIAAELARHTPNLWEALQAIDLGLAAGETLESLLALHYPNLEKISIDYAIIEKAARVVMLEATFDWDDVGAWPAIERHYPKDAAGNVACAHMEVLESADNIVYCRDEKHLVALVGVQDLVVVKTADATLVCHKDKAQEIKNLVKVLGSKAGSQHLL